MPHQPDADFIALQEALAGEYSLDREIGRGGMGVVYLAREVRLARPVAIKVLPPALAARPDLREAFLREARTVAALTHPNIVAVHAAGERGGFVYIVMAFVEGTTLGERIRTRGPLLPGQAARVLREVAWALAYAHGARLVHRDVTAENILLERGSERALVTDFGIASAMHGSAVSSDGHIMGNAHYVSPEQACGEPLDARSDLYSLGVAGYYALTGRLPFDGETSAEVVRKQLTEIAPSITSVAPSVPPRLAAAVERCLHKEPIRRYRNAESFAEAIDLAFEHAKEIPAPLRVWLNKREREGPARLAAAGFGAILGVNLAFAAVPASGWTLFALFLAGFLPVTSLGFAPAFFRLRRVLGDGFVVDDLHGAMREQQLARAEELEYERRHRARWVRPVMRVLLGASVGGFTLAVLSFRVAASRLGPGALLAPQHLALDQWITGLMFGSLAGFAVSATVLAGEFVRTTLAQRIAAASVSFWKSRFAARLARVASVGLKPVERPALGMPLLTEVALGRATDHLYDALPKASRRQLAALPQTVRHLEGDAGRLRASIEQLDDQLAMFERGGEMLHDDERARLAESLRATRAVAAERLASTVSALETIRLDLLRLQMGSAGLESVTASLDAARHIGDRIAESLAAQDSVERLLASEAPRRGTRGELPPSSSGTDEDTPVRGVPATHA